MLAFRMGIECCLLPVIALLISSLAITSQIFMLLATVWWRTRIHERAFHKLQTEVIYAYNSKKGCVNVLEV
jgi:hypothetical protein